MITIIKNGEVYAPHYLGKCDVLLANDKIAALSPDITVNGIPCNILDAGGKKVCPGFIDQHVHITGGGGQFGHSSFIPEVAPEDLIAVGTTTVLGLLGTDGFVKELTTLYSKAKSLDQAGLTAYMLTGFYGLPEKTLTGSIAKDLIFIDKVIGCKLALSDDRGSFPTEQEILRLIHQVRLGGFTSGKGGILHIHLGNLPEKINLLMSIIKKYPSLISYLSPTHTIRTEELFAQCLAFAKKGGLIDISTGGTKFTEPYLAVKKALEAGVPLENLTFSSDGRGGVKKVNPLSGEITYRPAPLDLNFREMVKLVRERILPLEKALALITVNPARNLKICGKGRLEPGYDADLVLLNRELQITAVISKGKIFNHPIKN